MRHTVIAVAFLAAAQYAAPEQLPSLEYDRSQPLGLAPAEVALRNLTFLGAAGKRIEATVALPSAPGRRPAVLFVHWYAHAPSSNRTQFLPDALFLARRGIVSLMVDTAWSEPSWFANRDPGSDFEATIAQARDLRRALDLLGSLDQVDSERIAYVGHDFGAMHGALLMAADTRIKALAFVAGTKAFSDWYLLGRTLESDERARIEQSLAPLDPTRHLAAARSRPIFFQFASNDRFVPRAAADALVTVTKEPKRVAFYVGGHDMNLLAMQERLDWLLDVLGRSAPSP